MFKLNPILVAVSLVLSACATRENAAHSTSSSHGSIAL